MMERQDFLGVGIASGSARAVLIAVALFCCHPGHLLAQDYPSRPVKILVPTAAGGLADTLARLLAAHLTNVMGQQFYVENRGGAGNVIGIDSVARSPADGHTLLMGNSGPLAVNPVLYKKVPYDPVKDFAPITQGTSYMYVLVVPAALPVAGLADDLEVVLVLQQRAEPGPDQRLVVGEQDPDHALRPPAGRRALTRKPPSGRGPASRMPPSALARSRIPTIPCLAPFPDAGAPVPSSVTSTTSASPSAATVTVARLAPAWRTTLVSDSCTIR